MLTKRFSLCQIKNREEQRSYIERNKNSKNYHLLLIEDSHEYHAAIHRSAYPSNSNLYLVKPHALPILKELITFKGWAIQFDRQYIKEVSVFDKTQAFKEGGIILQLTAAQFDEIATQFALIKEQILIQRSSFSAEIINYLLNAMLLRIYQFKEYSVKAQDNYTGSKQFKQFQLLLNNNFSSEHKPEFYARQLHVIKRTLANITKKCCGMTPHQMILEKLLREIERQLIKSEFQLKEVAMMFGFEEYSYFTRFFKNQKGISPSEFKKRFS